MRSNLSNNPDKPFNNVCPSELYRCECCQCRIDTSRFTQTVLVIKWCFQRLSLWRSMARPASRPWGESFASRGLGCSGVIFNVHHGLESNLAHHHVFSLSTAIDVFLRAGFDGGGFRNYSFPGRSFPLHGPFRRGRARAILARQRKHGAHTREKRPEIASLLQEWGITG